MCEPHHKGTWDGSGVADLLGWKIISEETGLVRAEFEAKEEFRNPKGAITGGILAAMLDMIISAAVRSSLAENQSPRATLEMKVNFIGAGMNLQSHGSERSARVDTFGLLLL